MSSSVYDELCESARNALRNSAHNKMFKQRSPSADQLRLQRIVDRGTVDELHEFYEEMEDKQYEKYIEQLKDDYGDDWREFNYSNEHFPGAVRRASQRKQT